MTNTLQVDETIKIKVIGLHDAPKLLIEWSSPWEEFTTSIRPAFQRSPARLAGETPYGIFPYRGMLTSWGVEALLLLAAIFLPAKLARLRPYVPPSLPKYDVIYYSGDELPRTEDLGGAQAGASGRAGGTQAHHNTQTIRVARGGSLTPKIVDAPTLKLPSSMAAVANLLAVKPNPGAVNLGPARTEGLHSSLTLPSFPTNVVAPAPASVIRDRSRIGLALDSVIPPAPNVSHDKTLIAPALTSAVIPPSPSVSRDRTPVTPSLTSRIVEPAPSNVSRDAARSAPALSGSVIPPAPAAVSREGSRSPVQMANSAVIPPPVSTPERENARNSKVTLPAPSVIAPPPSTEISRDLHSLASGSVSDTSNAVIPPPAQVASGGFMNNLLGKLLGTTDVVPPPPNMAGSSSSGSTRTASGGTGGTLATSVVPPPPSVGGSGAASGRSGAAGANGAPFGTGVVPPPPSVSGSATGRAGGTVNGSANSGGTLATGNVVPPPPSLGAGSGVSGAGRGPKGVGLGGPLDAVSGPASPGGGGGSGGGSGVVVSSQPGSKVGKPAGGGAGVLALSPAGGDKPGLGGSGGGSGIGHGTGPGSGLTGEGTGAAKAGIGRGSDPNARGGISPASGSGGAGSAPSGNPVVPGVSVSGGTSIVTLPSFGSTGGSDPNIPGRSSVKEQQGPAITVQATSRSGGAFNYYDKLPGDNYTIYLDTSIGIVVMQYADAASAAHPYSGSLTSPVQLRTDLPVGISHSRLEITCVLDASGNLKNVRVIVPGPAAMTAKVLAALPSWKFRPAMRGNQPVEVNAILGFGTDTNDHN